MALSLKNGLEVLTFLFLKSILTKQFWIRYNRVIFDRLSLRIILDVKKIF